MERSLQHCDDAIFDEHLPRGRKFEYYAKLILIASEAMNEN